MNKCHNYIYNVGEIINGLEILEQIRYPCYTGIKKMNTQKGYKFKCVKDGYIDYTTEYNLKNRHGCPVCNKQIAMKGYNDIYTTNPDFAKLLEDPEDGYYHTIHSNAIVNFICPQCGKVIEDKKIHDVYRSGLFC